LIYLGPTIYWDDATDWQHGDAAQLFALPDAITGLIQFGARIGLGAWLWQGGHIVPHFLLTADQAAALREEPRHPRLRLVTGDGVLHAARLWRLHRSTEPLKKPPRNRK